MLDPFELPLLTTEPSTGLPIAVALGCLPPGLAMPAALVGRGPAGSLGLVEQVRTVCTVPDVKDSTSHCPAGSLLPSTPQAVSGCCRALGTLLSR